MQMYFSTSSALAKAALGLCALQAFPNYSHFQVCVEDTVGAVMNFEYPRNLFEPFSIHPLYVCMIKCEYTEYTLNLNFLWAYISEMFSILSYLIVMNGPALSYWVSW